MDKKALEKAIEKTKLQMEKAAKELNFQQAAKLRDEMYALQDLLNKK
jgi:excinuclease ABC subunit B